MCHILQLYISKDNVKYHMDAGTNVYLPIPSTGNINDNWNLGNYA